MTAKCGLRFLMTRLYHDGFASSFTILIYFSCFIALVRTSPESCKQRSGMILFTVSKDHIGCCVENKWDIVDQQGGQLRDS